MPLGKVPDVVSLSAISLVSLPSNALSMSAVPSKARPAFPGIPPSFGICSIPAGLGCLLATLSTEWDGMKVLNLAATQAAKAQHAPLPLPPCRGGNFWVHQSGFLA
jgi:hypothetical protein